MLRRLETYIRNLPDSTVKYIWNTSNWDQGTARTRQICREEFDKRFGAESWPNHISRD
jgi:hypothetical protein